MSFLSFVVDREAELEYRMLAMIRWQHFDNPVLRVRWCRFDSRMDWCSRHCDSDWTELSAASLQDFLSCRPDTGAWLSVEVEMPRWWWRRRRRCRACCSVARARAPVINYRFSLSLGRRRPADWVPAPDAAEPVKLLNEELELDVICSHYGR